MQPNESQEDPFGEIGNDLSKLKSRPMPRAELLRKILAAVIMVIGTVGALLTFLFVPMGNPEDAASKSFFALGAICWGLAIAVYDGRLFGKSA